jgi:predicted ATPase
MIRSFAIDNFKSLVKFSLPTPPHKLPKLLCLIGLNGAGKSTLLQAFSFIGQLASGDISPWLKRREWKKSDLSSRLLGNKKLIHFRIDFELNAENVTWSGAYNIDQQRCTSESISVASKEILEIKDGALRVSQAGSAPDAHYPKGLDYEGSGLSLLKGKTHHPTVMAVKQFAQQLRALDMLTPQAMRQRSRAADSIGYGGEQLAGFLHGLPSPEHAEILSKLQTFYPNLQNFRTQSLKAGWKDLSIAESWNDDPIVTFARHMNDGMLRLLGILAQLQVSAQSGEQLSASCLLFDEIENGINPELMPQLINHLLAAPQQIILTTHSPMILNWLPNDVAQESVVLLYRNAEGATQATRFFDLPSTQKRLGLLGPGEVFVDVDLREMAEEAQQLTLP